MSRPSSRDPENDPAATLGKTLRRLREAAGITSYAAASSRIGYGQDTVRKAESGTQVPTQEVLHKLLDAYQLAGPVRETVIDLWKLARRSKGPVPEFAEKYIAAEKKAEFLHLWALLMIPGPLQTREYAYAMYVTVGMDEDEAAEKADARIDRQAVLERPEPPHVTAVIHESVLHCLVGSPEIMIAQLTRLLEWSQRRDITIQIVPDAGYFVGMEGAFEIASGNEIPDTLIMLAVEDQVSEDHRLTRKVLAMFEEIRGHALSIEETRTVIQEAIEKWKSQQ